MIRSEEGSKRQSIGEEVAMHQLKRQSVEAMAEATKISRPVQNTEEQLLGLDEDNPEEIAAGPDLTTVNAGDKCSTTAAASQQQQKSKKLPAFEWPLLFERAAKTWWHPQFDSPILEQQYWKSLLPRTTIRFQFGLTYLLLMTGVVSIYFGVMAVTSWVTYLILAIVVFFIVMLILMVTYAWPQFYQKHCFKISLVLSIVLCSASLVATASLHQVKATEISPAGLFAVYLEVLLLLYTVVPLPLYGTLIIGATYSMLFEVLLSIAMPQRVHVANIIINVLLHLCIHVIGIHILITIQVRMRDTFMKVGQSLMVKKQLVAEKGLKEKMIHSVMPPKVANWLMKGHAEDFDEASAAVPISGSAPSNGDHGDAKSKAKAKSEESLDSKSDYSNYCGDEDDEDYCGPSLRKISSPRSSNQGDIRSIFRPFNMNTMNDVSILFADIVGFTKMSSNKTASQLVGLLNDLFGRFDNLCTQSGCEKISTLGDCYYCVSGCPEPTLDHATNCVEMGLAMISAIKDFDEDRHESVNMRVGIHTGTVLCGIVGKTRFKFDVWSNDVTLANKMESTGRPGMVHISEKTYSFLKNDYLVEDGEVVGGLRTYFICGRVSPDINPIKTRPDSSSIAASKPTNLVLQTDAINYQMAKSLPSLSAYLHKNNSAIQNHQNSENNINVDVNTATSDNVNHHNNGESNAIVRLNSHDDNNKKNKRQHLFAASMDDPSDLETIIPNGAKISTFKSATQRYSMLPSYQKRKKQSKQISLADRSLTRPVIQAQISLPENGTYANLLTRRYSHSLPSLQSARDYSVIASANDGRELLNSAMNESNEYNNLNGSGADYELGDRGHMPMKNINGAANWRQLRLQSDHALINCVLEDATHTSYFTNPPLRTFTLFFEDPKVEKDYRKTAWKGPRAAVRNEPEGPIQAKTWSPSVFNAYFDVLVVALVFGIICLDCFLSYPFTSLWMAYFATASLFLASVIFVMVKHTSSHLRTSNSTAAKAALPQTGMYVSKPQRPLLEKIYSWCRGWIPSHCLGSLLLALPVLAVLANFFCEVTHHHDGQRDFFLQLVFVSLAHFCNLSALNYFVKSLLASISASAIILLYSQAVCQPCDHLDEDDLTMVPNRSNLFFMEVVVSIVLIVALVWLLNREFEVSYRLSYHCSRLSARDRFKIQNLKNQADWLLHNIIPRHVAESLKRSAHYSENHREVGIIFASIVNFNELYDESYMGGKEYLRVLNELISDFDEILQRPEFHNVEKIKTIGSTFMAASGMNPYIRQGNTHKYQHIHELVEFIFELQKSVNDFNQSLIEFDLVLRVGLNFGDVTAGVIGTTKLYYDIWGDAVNISSRMETTGVQGRIQVPERCMQVLSEWYTFELRGSIFIKGKDNMTTYLLIGRKPDAFVTAVSSLVPF